MLGKGGKTPPSLGVRGEEPGVPQFPHLDLGKSGLKTRWLGEMLIHIFGVLFSGGAGYCGQRDREKGNPATVGLSFVKNKVN